MQPIVWVNDVIRFKQNNIVAYLIDKGSINLNQIAYLAADPANGFTQEDQEHLAQLIGYSVAGFGGLSYASPETVEKADEIADAMIEERDRQ